MVNDIEINDVKVKSLFKAIKLLDYFTNESPERGISELSELTGMFKSSIHNIVSTFEKCGFLEKNTDNNKYRLGLKILQFSNCIYSTHDLRNIVHPYMENICKCYNECTYFVIPSGNEVIYIDAVYPSGIITTRSIIGVKAPFYCTGVGKAIMAYLPAEKIEQIIIEGLVPFTQNTITDRNGLLKELEQIKKLGYAVDNMEHEYGIKCVAVPIRNIKGNVVSAISVSGPSLRFTEDDILKYADYLKNVSSELSIIIQR